MAGIRIVPHICRSWQMWESGLDLGLNPRKSETFLQVNHNAYR
jgi:hypothetical protein